MSSNKDSTIPSIVFDFDITNYTFSDIETFFHLDSNKIYGKDDIEKIESTLRTQLLSSGHLDKRFVPSCIAFLKKAKEWIIDIRCKSIGPTTLPTFPIQDTINIPRTITGANTEEPRENREIVIRPETQYIYTSNQDYVRGIINPLDKRVITRYLSIDSKFRTSGENSSNFTITIPSKLIKVVSMELLSIEIPQTYYNIHNKNSFFWISFNNDSHLQFISIPEGNYQTVSSLTQAITNAFTVAGISLQCNNTTNGIIQFSIVGTPSFSSFHLYFGYSKQGIIDKNEDSNGMLGWLLGFLGNEYVSNDLSPIIGIAPCLLQTVSYLYLAVNDFTNHVNNGFIALQNQSFIQPDILARIPIAPLTDTTTSFLIYSPSTMISTIREYFGPVELSKLHIRVYDSYGRIFSFQNRDISFCLRIHTMHDM